MDIEIKITVDGKEMKLEEARALYYSLKGIFEPVSIPSMWITPTQQPWEMPPVMTYASYMKQTS